LRAPPEGGACSSWIKHGFSHSLRQRPCSSWIKHGFSHSLRQRLRGVTGKWFGRVG
jgi:hypothetical protein